MKAIIDTEKCTGCGRCHNLFPTIFVVESGKSKVTVNPLPRNFIDPAREADRQCPNKAISVTP